jgi:DNA-binding MarR family transcriptional regulator
MVGRRSLEATLREQMAKAAALPQVLPGVDETSAHVFRAFVGALHLHRRLMMRELAGHGVHPGQAICLRLLATNNGITQRDLAEAMSVARPTVTKMLNSMEKAGLVRRRPDADDQRLTHVELTTAGRDMERKMGAAAAAYINATIGTMPEPDRRTLAHLLEQLGASIERAGAAQKAAQ